MQTNSCHCALIMVFTSRWIRSMLLCYTFQPIKFLAIKIWLFRIWQPLEVGFLVKFFPHFLRGHQELSINISHAIFGKIMRL